jgi:hypothetical protein
MDVNGQKSHATGQIDCSSSADKAILNIIPEKPWWVKDRPMKVELVTEFSTVRIK